MSGNAHAPYVVVSLRSLRQHYDGPIEIFAYPESIEVMEQIAKDPRVDAKATLWMPDYRGKNHQFWNKIEVMQSLMSGTNIYLDADTLIRGPLDLLFEMNGQHEFVATQFCDWKSNGGLISKRISSLLGKGLNETAICFVLDNPLPSVNGGVFSCRPDSNVLWEWLGWTTVTRESVFIADETCLHALAGLYYEMPEMFAILEGGAYNCSPKHQPKNLKDEDVKIWHFHGDSNVRPDKCKKGVEMWIPELLSCLDVNFGGILEWFGEAAKQNKYLSKLEIPGIQSIGS